MSVVVAQLGARMHYAVPRIFYGAGLLERLYTDISAVKGWPRLLQLLPTALRPSLMERLMTRIPEGIPSDRITAFTNFGLAYARRYARAQNIDERNAAFLWSGQEFGRRVVAAGFGSAQAVYVFNSAGLEILQEARRRGLKGVVEQTIIPRTVEWQILSEEEALFPDWQLPARRGLMKEYCEREAAEWAAADLIISACDVVRDGIIASGGPADRCVVVPYGIERTALQTGREEREPGPLRVLTVGAVGLRKGSPYVLEVARKLAGKAEFRMVGPVQILPEAEKRMREHVDLQGGVPRSEMASHYRWADVFFLPSLCEGSATSTYEALFEGLPVISTPQTGCVAREGREGFIVPMRDADTMAERLQRLAGDPDLLRAMSKNAYAQSANYTLEKYRERLVGCFREHNIIRDPA